MASIALSFNNVDLTTIDNGDGQLWVTSSDLAKALGYKTVTGITKLYNRNKGEFTGTMTALIDIEPSKVGRTLNSGAFRAETRIFSIRGCHLIAMFARTEIAAKFRVWALNVLDAHIEKTKVPLSIQQSLDAVYAIRAIESDKASGHGFGLNKWKGDKVVYDEAITTIMEYIQPQLPNLEVGK